MKFNRIIIFLFSLTLGSCRVASMQSVDQEQNNSLDAVEVELPDDRVIPEIIDIPKEEETLPTTERTCLNSTPVVLVAPLSFVERKNCTFGQGNNLTKREGYIRAIESQDKILTMPPAKEICNLGLKSKNDNLHYDDYFFITLNNRLLVSSELRWVDFLADGGDFKLFDFAKLKDKQHSYVEADPNYGTAYCYADNDCQVPDHDKVGLLDFTIEGDTMGGLTNLAKQENDFKFTVYATGDNDPQDCDFSSFDLELKIAYVPQP